MMSVKKNGRAKKGGQRGLNGEWYRGGQFLPSSEHTIKGKHRRGDSGSGNTRQTLLAPGEVGPLPAGHRSVFGRINAFVEDAGDGRLRLCRHMTDNPAFPWDRHFDNGLEEAREWVALFNEGLRTYPHQEGKADIESAREKRLRSWVVLYRLPDMAPLDPPLGFAAQAEDSDHAEEQLLDYEPEASVEWIAQTQDYEAALQDYWSAGMPADTPEM